MNRTDLIKSAQKLVQVSEKSTLEYQSKRDGLVDLINKRMTLRNDLIEMIGEGNEEMMKDNHANHARFMESIFMKYSPEVLVDTVLWVFRAYRSRNFSSTYWAAQLNAWMEIYKEQLTPNCYSEIYPYYFWMQTNIPSFNQLAEDVLNAPNTKHIE